MKMDHNQKGKGDAEMGIKRVSKSVRPRKGSSITLKECQQKTTCKLTRGLVETVEEKK
jgi:hypothetical protein